MPYKITWESRGLVKHFWGYLSGEEFLAAHHEVTEHPRCDGNLRYVISDFSDIEAANVGRDALQMYSVERNGTALYLPNIRGALIARHAPAQELCRQIVAPEYATPYEMQIFTTIEAARDWLKW